jgi:hypothetical protein
MSDSNRIQIVRPHQNIREFIYQKDKNLEDYPREQFLFNQHDYYTNGWKRLNTIQSLPFKDNWPITIGNAIASFSSGILG